MSYEDYLNGYKGHDMYLPGTSEDVSDYTLGIEHGKKYGAPLSRTTFDRLRIAPPNEHPAATSGAKREKLHVAPYDLVPFQEITDAYARVAELGAKKYAPWNWAKGLPRVQLLGSLLRHAFAYLRGEEYDRETGLLHTDHILWNAAALCHNVQHCLEDGRRPDPTYGMRVSLRSFGAEADNTFEGCEAFVIDNDGASRGVSLRSFGAEADNTFEECEAFVIDNDGVPRGVHDVALAAVEKELSGEPGAVNYVDDK